MKRSFAIALIILMCCFQVSAGGKPVKTSIEINLPSCILSLYKDGILYREYPVCAGRRSAPTPLGEYRVIYKAENPYWINEEEIVPPGPQNPLGTRWIGITKSIGIHGNNKPESIGTCESSGCIRMYNRDVEEVYGMVDINTPVTIKYERIEVFEDEYSADKAVIIYPDSYRYGDTDDRRLQERLKEMDIPEGDIKNIKKVLKRLIKKPVAVSQGVGIFLNGRLVTCDAVKEQKEIYVNCKAAKDVFGLTAEIADSLGIEVREMDGAVYVGLSQAVKHFGGAIDYDASVKNAYINMNIIKINGVFAGLNHGNSDRIDLMDADTVGQLGYEYSEDDVDVRIFDKGIMKLDRNNTRCIDTDVLIEALGGRKSISSIYGVIDMELPTFLRSEGEYYKTDLVDGRLVLNTETFYDICEEVGRVQEAFAARVEESGAFIDLELFLENYDYHSNRFGTVIDIKSKESPAAGAE